MGEPLRTPHIAADSDPLWHSLFAYSIGPDDAALSFVQRLARENGWTVPRAEQVLGEYRRFLYLAVRAGHPVTPSDAAENARFYENYTATLRSYERLFATPAPPDLWPSAQRRLFDDPRARRVHPRDGIIVSRGHLLLALLLAALAGATILLFLRGSLI